jgi:hypothetical protein
VGDPLSAPASGCAQPLARQATPLLPCGLTAEELAAITTAAESPERRSSPIPEARDLRSTAGECWAGACGCSSSAPVLGPPTLDAIPDNSSSLLPLLQASG